MGNITICSLLLLLIFSSCQKSKSLPLEDSNIKKYVFLGHIYQKEDSVDSRIERLDYSIYDQIWLGGDLCSETTKEKGTIDYLNKLFKLYKETTHWAVGNHDVRNGNLEWITNATGRPFFYSSHFDGITLLVLNTSLYTNGGYDTSAVNEQYELIQSVCDTIENSSHLVILTHHLIWGTIDNTSNAIEASNKDHSWYHLNFNPEQTYSSGLHPLLNEVTQRGVKVVCIAGDFGQSQSKYINESPDGITYIGSGISSRAFWFNSDSSQVLFNQYLEVTHRTDLKTLDFYFKKL